MLDIMLNRDGDIKISDIGDISLTESIRQAVLVRLRWIYSEWRLGPEKGFPWFEEVFIKNPNVVKLRHLFREEIVQVEGVTAANVSDVIYDPAKRTAKVIFTCSVGDAIFKEEVTLYG